MSTRIALICLLLGLVLGPGVHSARIKNKGVRPQNSRSCVVSDFHVLDDFDVHRYVGTWFTVSQSMAISSSFQRRSHYSLQENGDLAMRTHRVSPQDGCTNGMAFQADARRSTTPAKLLLQPRDPSMSAEDYWVIYTDYVDHALVYSCSQRNDDGTCARDSVWFLGRAGTLSVRARRHMNRLVRGLCVDDTRMTDVPTDCDAELEVPTSVESMSHAHHGTATSSCMVNNFQTIANFDKTQYTGTWYVIAHLQAGIYPYHRISHYTLDEQDSFRMVTHRVKSAGNCSAAWKFKGQAYTPETSETTSKMVLNPFGMPEYGEDYWVIYTDYTDHALTYSCREKYENGMCRPEDTHAWLMSRSSTLTPTAREHMETLLTEMCVNVDHLVNTPDECDEVLGPDSVIDQGPTNECIVDSFETMHDFDKEQYQGTWYVISHLEERYPYQRISNYTLEADGSFTMATERILAEGACDTAMRFEATASLPEESTSSSKFKLKPNISGMEFEAEDYWIMYTDYTHHAVVYSCGEKNPNGTCQKHSVWLMSRHTKMTAIERNYLLSHLPSCVDTHNLVDNPTECDEALGVSRADRCSVDKFSVMENFDISQYLGTWYVYKSLRPGVYPYQRLLQYSRSIDGSIQITSDGIENGPSQCDTPLHFEAKAAPSEGQVPSSAKLTLKPIGIPSPGEDYWIMYTDYDSHALVYGCREQKLDGTCQNGTVSAYILSRTKTLSDQAMRHMNMLLERFCVSVDSTIEVPSECDDTLEKEIMRPAVPKECTVPVDQLPIMDDFDINQYAGVWYTVSQIQPFEYPFHRVSNYTMQDNGRLLMSTDQFFRAGTCDTMHFEAHAFHQADAKGNVNPSSGKLFLQPLDKRIPPGNYWVAYTDYTDHALVYSCIRKTPSGECMPGHSMAWFMSRNPGLTEGAITNMTGILSQLCVKPSRLRDVITECDESIGIVSEPAKSPCDISTFQVKQDFVIEKFLGDWYELSHTRGDNQYMVLPDNEKMTIMPPEPDTDGHFSITMRNLRVNGECQEHDMPGKGWLSEDEPAKFVVSFPTIPEGFHLPQVVNHWVLDTDYDNYAITYTCHRIRRDGTCDPLAMGLWILGREKQIQPRFWSTVQSIIEGACVDQNAVRANPEPCASESNPEPVPTEQARCGSLGFGCCLLSGEPAIDAEYSNCPRVAPPVAGQMIPEAPVTIVEGQVQCDRRINCKMFCRFGFKTNSDGCEICDCADNPLIRQTSSHGRHQGPTCQDTLSSTMAKMSNGSKVRRGYYIPRCDEEGNYIPLQCLHPQESCWCAHPMTGLQLRKATYIGDTPTCDP